VEEQFQVSFEDLRRNMSSS